MVTSEFMSHHNSCYLSGRVCMHSADGSVGSMACYCTVIDLVFI